MQMVSGRNFSAQFPTDSSGIIINEAAAKLLSMRDPLNKKLYTLKSVQGGNAPSNIMAMHIIGVVKDFNFNSLRTEVTPLAFFMNSGTGGGSIAIRMNTRDIDGFINGVKGIWRNMAASQPFNYTFMDADFDRMYKSEQRTGNIFISFAVLAIFIACLGLFGLVTYAAEQRSREIGIRKVLGASVNNIVTLLSRDLLKLVALSAFIAFPFAWWAMHHWLEDFAYKVGIGWWVFAGSGILALVIAWGTVSFQAIKAALANPVKSLRTE
jgi:putative ABC transport system permease protein